MTVSDVDMSTKGTRLSGQRASEFQPGASLRFDPLAGQSDGQGFFSDLFVPPSQLSLVQTCLSLRVNSCADLFVSPSHSPEIIVMVSST